MNRKKQTCGDCGVLEGDYHDLGCDMESCPVCNEQLLFCGCTEDDLKHAERLRFILYPLICAKCGELWPKMFMVSTDDWKRFIEPEKRDVILCWDCYDFIRKVSTTEADYVALDKPRWLRPRLAELVNDGD